MLGGRERGTRRRRPGRVLGGVVVLVAVWVGATVVLFVWPRSDRPGRADAVVLFAGGRGERLAAAVDLMERGAAPTLVVSNGLDPSWPAANRICGEPQPFRVLCPRPDPDTTLGEARMTAALAAARGWRSLVLVTSTYHARRAGLLLDRCTDAGVTVVPASPRQSWPRTWWLAAAEWPALGRALLDRGC
jgi:uncharacterized SAM-binding protein YcdF (DUF218 family)